MSVAEKYIHTPYRPQNHCKLEETQTAVEPLVKITQVKFCQNDPPHIKFSARSVCRGATVTLTLAIEYNNTEVYAPFINHEDFLKWSLCVT